jgi:hypothetical protein
MSHLPPGSGGLIVGFVALVAIGLFSYLRLGKGPFNMDPQGKPGALEPILAKYIRLGEFVIGLATGSIVLLVGSSALHGQSGRLPWFYASPLLLLALCVVYGIAFIAWLIYNYEEYQHGNPHTRRGYALSLTLGFSSLTCFLIGYVWLIFQVTA